jgi:hypothetical protein
MKRSPMVIFLLAMLLDLTGYAKENTAAKSDSLPKSFLIINSFDAMSMKARKNKKELFRGFADSLKQYLYINLLVRNDAEIIVIPELLADPEDSAIYLLMAQHNATRAIVIKKVNAFFHQTGVEVEKEEDGKKRTASYDICAAVNYVYYSKTIRHKESETLQCEFYTTRNVMSGLFAAGPDIVGKSKHAHKIIKKNAEQYLREIHSFLSEE